MPSISSHSSLGGLLENIHSSHLRADLKGPKFIHFYNQIQLSCPFVNQSKWPPNGTLYPNVIWDICKYCELLEKWKETSSFPISLHLIICFCLDSPSPQIHMYTIQMFCLLSYHRWFCKFVEKWEQELRPIRTGGCRALGQLQHAFILHRHLTKVIFSPASCSIFCIP